ncbi:MAG: flagellar biosynthetic protein FliR [Gammaproteobacteria bacterium]|nr:flagellar biosynthetic protein FliR [Gammaproteobacteria bacterium]|tara:strand:+ start:74 stop:841 length:768 start_codon:yes stop_codon:yes gene_type:complete
MEILIPQIIGLFQSFLWPMIRISAFFLTAPFYGMSAVNLRVKIALAAAITWLILPMTEPPTVDPFSFNAIGLIAKEGAIGLLMGLFLQIVLAALISAGQIIAGGMGLSMANMIDPNMGNIPTLSQFFLIIGLLLFMSLGGHLILISMVTASFEAMPITTSSLSMESVQGFITWSSHMFLGSVAIAFPIIFGLLLVNMSLGIVSRAAPSLNVFAVGFPALIPAGLIMLLLTMVIWFEQVENLWFIAFDTLRGTLLG